MRHTFKIKTVIAACAYGGLLIDLSVSSETAHGALCLILHDPGAGRREAEGEEIPEEFRGVYFRNSLNLREPGEGSSSLRYTRVPHKEARAFARWLRWKVREEIRRRSALAREWNVGVAARAVTKHLQAKEVGA